MHDFNKPQPHVASKEEIERKRKLPVYMLIMVGVFLLALLIYMISDKPGNTNTLVLISHVQSLLLNA